MWAASTVQSMDAAGGTFMVWITEWDGLDPSDPLHEPAYEEGPYATGDEGEAWRRQQDAAERAAVEAVVRAHA